MGRIAIVALAGLAALGCGRLGFGAAPALDAGGDAPGTPPVPDSICDVVHHPIDALPATADLAVTSTAEGYAAIWVDAAGGSQAHGVLMAPNHQLAASLTMPDVEDPRLGGVTDAGDKLVLSTGSATSQTTWIVGRDLASAASEATQADTIVAHGPYPTDASQAPRVFVSASGTTLSVAYIGKDGVINTASTVSRVTGGKITDLACTDGPDHAHCVWAEALSTVNGESRCTASDVDLRPVPSVPGGPIVSADCYDVRTSSGPDAADSMIVVWRTADRRVEAHYVGSGGLDLPRTIALAGTAPKVQFDGFVFWIAYLDGDGVLQLASFDTAGTITTYGLPGWVPLGGEAFELVRRRGETALVLLTGRGLEFLKICG